MCDYNCPQCAIGVMNCKQVNSAFGPGDITGLGHVEDKQGGRRQSGWYGRENTPRSTRADSQPCARCHKRERMKTASGRAYSWCKECRAEYEKARYSTPDRLKKKREQNQAWYRRWYADPEKRERMRAYARAYYAAHREKFNAKDRARRRRK